MTLRYKPHGFAVKLIVHRRNTAAELAAIPDRYGVEIDLRSAGEALVLHHDPFTNGEHFERWLEGYRHGTLILNVKEDGLEPRLTELMQARSIEDYFFLDQAFPTLVRCARTGERRCAVRVSEFEPAALALGLAGRVDWVWVDCFTRFPLMREEAGQLVDAGFKLCIVSPELQGRDAETEVPAMAGLLRERRIRFDAVCTKHPDLWEREWGREHETAFA